MITTVTTAAGLWTALKTAHGGDTVLLAPGTYASVSLNTFNPNGMVTITSADPTHPAVIQGLTVMNSSNMTFSHLELTPDPSLHFGALIQGDTNVQLDSLNIHSSPTQSGDGVMLRDDTNVSLTHSSIHDLARGIVELTTHGATVTGDVLANLTSQVITTDGAASSGVTFSGNTLPAAAVTPPAVTTTTSIPTTVGAGHSATVTVTSAGGLLSALKAAHAGDTIQLAAGNYGEINLNGLNFSSAVTVTSADPSHEAVITGLNVQNSSNLAFSHLELTPDAVSTYNATLQGDHNITLDQLNVHGGATANGNGVMLRESTNVSLTNSNIHDLWNGVSHIDDDGVMISGNTIHGIATDGIHGGGSSDITITANVLSDFNPGVGDHPDAIQFWTSNTTASVHDLVVTNNVIERGTGAAMQGIFMNNENNLTYDNVTITGNAMVGTMYNGILVYNAANVTVANNYVQGDTDMNSKIWLDQVTGAQIHNNAATDLEILSGVTQASVSGNTVIAQAIIGDVTQLDQWLGRDTTPVLPLEANVSFSAPIMSSFFGNMLPDA